MSKRRSWHVLKVGVILILQCLIVPSVRADEFWIAPTAQQDVGGLGIGSNGIWPVAAIGVSRFAWGVPDNLQTFQHAKIALIPHAPGGPSTLSVFVCAAQNGQPVAGSCAGPFSHPFTGVANQLIEVDISAELAPRIGAAGLNNLAIAAFTSPTTTTDHLVGLRFAFIPTPPAGVATLASNKFTGTQTAPAFVGNGSELTGINYSNITGTPASLPPSGPAGGDLAATYPNPLIGTGRVRSDAIADGTIVNADINTAAAIAASKISGLGTLATLAPTGTPGAGTFLRGDGAWAPSGARVLNASGQFVGFLIGFEAPRTLTLMTSAGHVFHIFTSGQLVPDPIIFSGPDCTGTPLLPDGVSGNRNRFARALSFASDTNLLYTMSNPDSNGESVSALQTIQSFRATSAAVPIGIGACTANGNTGGWGLAVVTPATAGIPVVSGSNPLRVAGPLQFQ